MAWVYCDKCGEGQEEPTDREVLTDEYLCWNCHEKLDPRKSNEDVMLSMLERIETLETLVASHKTEVF